MIHTLVKVVSVTTISMKITYMLKKIVFLEKIQKYTNQYELSNVKRIYKNHAPLFK
jgi:hypothetical protein